MIFIMSSMNTYESNGKSKQTIKKTVQKTSEISEDIGVVNSKPTEKQINETVDKLNFPLRKCAHATEYAILALLIIFVLNSFWGKNYTFKKIAIAVGICCIYSLTDEYHQSFVAGRTNQFTDCLIDTLGSIIMCIIYSAIKKISILKNKKIPAINIISSTIKTTVAILHIHLFILPSELQSLKAILGFFSG